MSEAKTSEESDKRMKSITAGQKRPPNPSETETKTTSRKRAKLSTTFTKSTTKDCKHPIVFKGLCGNCGADVYEKFEDKEINENGVDKQFVQGVRVTREYNEELSKRDVDLLLKNKKLVLLLDLDETLVHTCNRVPERDEFCEDIIRYRIGDSMYFTKIRPYALEFLRICNELFEMHIASYGQRIYTHTLTQALDPKTDIFDDRVLSRDELKSSIHKTKNLTDLFPLADRFLIMVDDRADVWEYSDAHIMIRPYKYFRGVGDINSPAAQRAADATQQKADEFAKEQLEQQEQRGLNYIGEENFFEEMNAANEPNDDEPLEENEDKNSEDSFDPDNNDYEVLKPKSIREEEEDDLNLRRDEENELREEEEEDDLNLGRDEENELREEEEDELNLGRNEENETGDMEDEDGVEQLEKTMEKATKKGEEDAAAVSAMLNSRHGSEDQSSDNHSGNDNGVSSSSSVPRDSSNASDNVSAGQSPTGAGDAEEHQQPTSVASSNTSAKPISASAAAINYYGYDIEKIMYMPLARSGIPGVSRQRNAFRKVIPTGTDPTLLRIADILKDIHDEFYRAYDESIQHNLPFDLDVKTVMANMRKRVLAGEHIVLSGICELGKDPTKHWLYWEMERFGAVGQIDIDEHTTVIVAAANNTEKVAAARILSIPVVTAVWLLECIYDWRKHDKDLYTFERSPLIPPQVFMYGTRES